MFQVPSFKFSRIRRDPVATGQVFPPLAGSRCDGTSFKKKSAGFSLVELLVSIFIIVTLLATALISYRKGEKNLALERAAYKLAQDMRRAEEMAMEAKESVGPGGQVQVPLGGYGIYIKKGPPYYIIIFADFNDNSWYDENPYNEKIEGPVQIESGVKIKEIVPSQSGQDHINIVFVPPDPRIVFMKTPGYEFDDTAATITLCLENDETKVKTVRINKAGLIEVY